MKPLLLDLFCGAGGAAMGYHRAGFEVVGVDIKHQPRYPFAFRQGDAMSPSDWLEALNGRWPDVIHASPPCQAFTSAQVIRGREHPDLLTPIRQLLKASEASWAIENVVKAPMRADATLCGSMFGLEVERHRLFESNVSLSEPPACNHVWKAGRPVGVYGHTGTKATGNTSGNHGFLAADWRAAMDIDWMSRNELAQSIPPAYTEWVGRQIMAAL